MKKAIRIVGLVIMAIAFVMVMLGMNQILPEAYRIAGYVMLLVGSVMVFTGSYLTKEEQRARWGDRDKLTNLEGIGPRLAGILNDNGIRSYKELAGRKPEELAEMLRERGIRTPVDTTSWPVQADLAAKEKWHELKMLQQSLKEQGRNS